jgi:hypothetical protein
VAAAGIELTFWSGGTVELNVRGTRVCFDPYVVPEHPVHYALITHEHYDHFHEVTLKRLAAHDELALVVASRSCFDTSRLHSPKAIDPPPEDLRWLEPHRVAVLYPELAAGGAPFPGPGRLGLGELDVVGISSGENPIRWADGSLVSAGYDGPEHGGYYGPIVAPPLPTVGYLVTDRRSGYALLHPGDIDETYPELERLRGRVTHLLVPIGKLHGREAELVDLVRPEVAIPVHYHLDVEGWPVPWHVTEDEIHYADWITGAPKPGVAADDPGYLADVVRLIDGHWYPSPPDPLGFVRELKEQVGATRVAMLEAGTAFAVDPATGAIDGATEIA